MDTETVVGETGVTMAMVWTKGVEKTDYRTEMGEFTLVNSRNIELTRFAGESTSKMAHLEFNESQRELGGIKRRNGDILHNILMWAEQRGDTPISNNQLEQMEKFVAKIWEYNRAIHTALTDWTEGDAKRLVKYEVNGGTDAWR